MDARRPNASKLDADPTTTASTATTVPTAKRLEASTCHETEGKDMRRYWMQVDDTNLAAYTEARDWKRVLCTRRDARRVGAMMLDATGRHRSGCKESEGKEMRREQTGRKLTGCEQTEFAQVGCKETGRRETGCGQIECHETRPERREMLHERQQLSQTEEEKRERGREREREKEREGARDEGTDTIGVRCTHHCFR